MRASRPVPTVYVATLHRPGSVLGGIQKHINVFAEEAPRRGVSVRLLTPFHAPKALWLGAFGAGKAFARISGPFSAWWYERARLTLLRRVLLARVPKDVPSILYAQDPVSTEAALALKGRGYPVQVVSAVHFNLSTADEWVGKGIITREGALYRRMLARDAKVLPQADRLVFVSEFMRAQVTARIPAVANVPSQVIPNFVPGAPPPDPPPPVQADLLTIGTLEPRKNQAFILRVLAEAHRRGYPYRLTVVGGGPSRGELERVTRELGLSDHVTFTGAVSNASSLLHAHRAYVHASRMESFGIVLAEALAAGKPVFAAPIGGVPEVFTDGVEGVYWDLEDVGDAAQRLIQVLEDPARYAQMAAAAAARHAAYFSPEVVQGRLVEAVLGYKLE